MHKVFNFEGVVGTSPVSGASYNRGYVQVFRWGVIEAVRDIDGPSDQSILSPEHCVFRSIDGLLNLLKKLQVSLPVFALLTLARVKDHSLVYPDEYGLQATAGPVKTDFLWLPEVEFRRLDDHAPKAFKRAFDTFWNTFNFLQSPFIDDEGNYIGK